MQLMTHIILMAFVSFDSCTGLEIVQQDMEVGCDNCETFRIIPVWIKCE